MWKINIWIYKIVFEYILMGNINYWVNYWNTCFIDYNMIYHWVYDFDLFSRLYRRGILSLLVWIHISYRVKSRCYRVGELTWPDSVSCRQLNSLPQDYTETEAMSSTEGELYDTMEVIILCNIILEEIFILFIKYRFIPVPTKYQNSH